MSHSITIEHVSVLSLQDFAATTKDFESRIGKFDSEAVKALALPNPPLEEMRARIEAMAGSSGFMQFGRMQTFGLLLPMAGKAPGKANQYLVGNPLIALQMVQHDLRVGLYVPLRVLLFEDANGKTHLEYDLPSSVLGQFQNDQVNAVARMLDQKLDALIKAAAGLQ